MTELARRRAWRWGLAATATTAVLTYGGAAALRFDLASTTVSFVMFAGLFGGTAAFLGAELSRYAQCPRCGHQQPGRPRACPTCGYDVRNRPRWACPDGHAWSYGPGLCDCGRRLREKPPPDVRGPVVRALLLGLAVFVALVLAGLLAGR